MGPKTALSMLAGALLGAVSSKQHSKAVQALSMNASRSGCPELLCILVVRYLAVWMFTCQAPHLT